jgi:hypothetical protein
VSGSDWFGGCLGIVAAGFIGLAVFGPVGALLGALTSSVVVGLVLSAQDRRRKRQQAAVSATPSPSDPSASAEDALRQLEGLRASGLIGAAEYDAKKAEILERL